MQKIKIYYIIVSFIFLIIFGSKDATSQTLIELEATAFRFYNITNFVDWSKTSYSDTSKFVIGIIDQPPFDATLFEAILIKTLDEKKKPNWDIVRFSSCNNIPKCHILFVPQLKPSEINTLVKSLVGNPTLTIGNNIEQFCSTELMINLINDNNCKPFVINKTAIEAVDLQITSQIITLGVECKK